MWYEYTMPIYPTPLPSQQKPLWPHQTRLQDQNPLLLLKKVPAQCTEAQLLDLQGGSCITKNFRKSGNSSCQLPKVNSRHFSFMQVHWNESFLLARISLWTCYLLQIFCKTHSCNLTHWNKTVFISIRNGCGQILTIAGYGTVLSLFISASLPFMVPVQSAESVMNITGK